MRVIHISLLLILLIASIVFGQVRPSKIPIDAGVGCVDVTKRLNSKVENGQMIVAQCCGGLKLIADVKEESINGNKINRILKWHVINQDNKELKAEIGQARRESTGKDRVDFKFEETVIVVREQKICFIVDRKDTK